jgi:DNA-binding beta-propeller fold protein YncE
MRRLVLLLALSATGAGLIAAAALAARTHDAPCPARGTVWAVERFDTGPNTLAAFDASSGDVKGVVTIGKRPIGVVAPRHTGKVYTADERSNQLTVVSKRDFSVVTRIPMGALPHHMMATRTGKTIYVGEYGTNKVGVVDTESDTLVAEYTASENASAHTHAVWITRDGEDLYATNEGATTSAPGTLSKLDAETGFKEWEVPIGLRPSEVLVTPNGKTAYVTIRNENKVKVLDLRGDLPALVAEVPIGGMPDTMTLTNDGRTLVVGLRAIPQMALMDTRTLEVRPVTFMGYGISGHQALSPNGRVTYIGLESTVTNRPGAIGVVDNRSGEVIDTWEYPGGPWPHGVSFDRQALR